MDLNKFRRAPSNLKRHTLDSFASELLHLQTWLAEHKIPLEQLERSHFAEFVQHIGWTKACAKHCRSALRAYDAWAGIQHDWLGPRWNAAQPKPPKRARAARCAASRPEPGIRRSGPVGIVRASGFVTAPADVAAHETWHCPICRSRLSGLVDECVGCNGAIVDPDLLDERDAQARFLANETPSGASLAAIRVG